MNKIFTVLIRCFSVAVFCHLQTSNAQIIELGTGTFIGSNVIGPVNTSTAAGAASRYAYIFPQSVVSTLKHGDSIVSLDFLRNTGGSLSGSSNMIIYMRATANANYGTGNINWVNQKSATGMKKVYDKDPTSEIGSTNTWIRFTLDTVFVFDTTFGKGLEILIEYRQSSSSSQSTNIYWTYENRFTVNGYALNQCKYTRTNGGVLQDTTNSSTDAHPTIKINFPRTDNNAKVLKVYSLGKIPVPLGNPDSVKVLIKNIGKRTMNNHKVYIISQGANKLIDSTTFSIGPLDTKLFTMPVLSPSNLGLDTLIVRIAKDDDSIGNESQVYRIATENIYSYKDPTQPLAGGIGFNGGTGDFVAKFYSNTAKAINQISVSFAGQSQKFRLGIWAADGGGGEPGTNVWTSDTLTSAPNFITPVLPPVSVSGSFYVGVRQIGTTNVAFGYQEEDPVRPQTFYYASPYGDTNWVDFAPDAPFKFAIEPRLQADNDVAPFSYDYPKDTLDLIKVKTMAPKATIINYGAKDQTTPFTVTMNIRRYGTLVYTSNRTDTLGTMRKHKITFDSTFLPTQAGDYDVQVITRLGSDQMRDNDTLKGKVVVAIYKDVGVGSLFDPDNSTDYEQFIDTIYPTANIQNFGLDATPVFNVTAQILDSNNVLLYTDTKSTNLASNNSSILSFKPYGCNLRGKLKFRIFTRLPNDNRKKNDTVVVVFNVVRSNDVTVTKSIYPQANKGIAPPATAKFVNVEMENLGDLNQATPFLVYNRIYYQNSLIYADSTVVECYRGITTNMFFKKFLPTKRGYYTMVCFSSLSNDQVRSNDTLRIGFAYGLPDDINPTAVSPAPNSVLDINKAYAPKLTVTNIGFNSQNTAFPVVFNVTKGASLVYSDSKNTTLDSGETKTITFDSSMQFSDTGLYLVEAYTNLGIDFDRTNDTIRTYYQVNKHFDLGVTAIMYPTLTDTIQVNKINDYPKVVIENLGDSLVTQYFSTTLRIINTNTKALLYKQTKDTFFSVNAPLELLFPRLGVISAAQPLTVIAQTEYAKDEYRKNDSTYDKSQVELWYDALAQSIALPQNNGVYKTNFSAIKPVVAVKNTGTKSIETVQLKLTIKYLDSTTSNETIVYADSLNVDDLSTLSTSTKTFANSFDFTTKTPGLYKCYYNTLYDKDQVGNNNNLVSTFRIQDASGIRMIDVWSPAIYPNPATHTVCIYLKSVPENPLQLIVYDMQGKEVLQQTVSEHQQFIDISSLANGVYFVTLNGYQLKLVIQH
ncbi:MAG: T9SS type A sorting domain-containing protein [Bacteroidota bacterium]